MKNYIAKLFGCRCACHDYCGNWGYIATLGFSKKDGAEHSSKCCLLMNGYIEK